MQHSQSQSQSPSSIPATQCHVQQRVYGPGVAKGRKSTQASQQSQSQTAATTKKKSTPNTARKKVSQKEAEVFFEEMPNLDINSIYWVVPEPGYGNPLNLSAIPENTGKVFYRWLNWESNDCVGYILYDKTDMKYWADAASIHMLAGAKLAGITHDYFFFTVFRQGKDYKYGFTPKSYLSADQITMFENYKQENQKLAEVGNYIPKPIKIESEEGEEHHEEEHHEEEDGADDDDDSQLSTADAAGEEKVIELD